MTCFSWHLILYVIIIYYKTKPLPTVCVHICKYIYAIDLNSTSIYTYLHLYLSYVGQTDCQRVVFKIFCLERNWLLSLLRKEHTISHAAEVADNSKFIILVRIHSTVSILRNINRIWTRLWNWRYWFFDWMNGSLAL